MATTPHFAMIEGYFLSATKAVSTLFGARLYGHALVVAYSTIDACGLLDASLSETEATPGTFKAWVKKYMLRDPALEFNETDLWAARCAVLHTYTTESRLSKAGAARQLQYYTGNRSDPQIQKVIAFAKTHEGGAHLPVHYGELCEAFFSAIKGFVPDLDANCTSNQAYATRLRKILQVHHIAPAA